MWCLADHWSVLVCPNNTMSQEATRFLKLLSRRVPIKHKPSARPCSNGNSAPSSKALQSATMYLARSSAKYSNGICSLQQAQLDTVSRREWPPFNYLLAGVHLSLVNFTVDLSDLEDSLVPLVGCSHCSNGTLPLLIELLLDKTCFSL